MGLRSVSLLLLLLASVAADCPPGTKFEGKFNRCYKYYSTPQTFFAAEKTCNGLGGNLVDIHDSREDFLVAGLVMGETDEPVYYWIGASLLISPTTWTWTNGAAFNYSNWNMAPLISSNCNNCGSARHIDSKWVSKMCTTFLPFVCAVNPDAYVPGTCPTQSPAPTCSSPSNSSNCPNDAVCSPGYKLYKGNCLCYKFVETIENFDNAKEICADEGGMLASIPSQDVNEFLTGLPGIDCEGVTCPWIGLYCTSSSLSSCTWADGSRLGSYSNFFYKLSGESNPFGSKHTLPPPYSTAFALIVGSPSYFPDQHGTWEDQATPGARYFFCQKMSTRMSEEQMGAWKSQNKQSEEDG